MAHDPSTHQIWVRLVGLPLQAWTILEIHAFVQNFAQPLQILPFGSAAGHYRDITVLVAAKHPAHIPLAFIYREGEYSTQVDVLILAFRPWEDSYFHPPDDQQPQQGPHNQLQQPEDHIVSANLASSSSSNNASGEPTINFSSWSPKGYTLQPIRKQKWIPKLTISRLHPDATPFDNSLDFLPRRLAHIRSIEDHLHLQPPDPKTSPLLVTENPTHLHCPRWITSIILTHPRYSLSPIFINTLSTLSAERQNSTMGEAPKNPITSPLHAAPSPQATQLMTLTLREEYKSPAQMIGEAFIKQIFGQLKSPTKPKINYITLQAPHLHQAPLAEAHFGNPRAINLSQVPYPPAPLQDPYTNPQDTSPAVSFDSHLDSNLIENTESNLFVPHPNQNDEMTQMDTITVSPTLNESEPTEAVTSSPLPKFPSPPPKKFSTHQNRKKDRSNMLPSRRSQRLQAKQHTVTTPKRAVKNTNQKKTISFNRDNLDIPLDIDTTLAILQATGLQINEQVRLLIEEAAAKDLAENQDNAIAKQPTPTTPLHDPIPSLSVPDFDLPL